MNIVKDSRFQDVLRLFFSLAACFSAGFIGSIFIGDSVRSWYTLLLKPSFTPPSWLMAPMWFLLYILMGISAFLIWRKGVRDFQVKESMIIFIIQLSLNILWSYAFFGLRSPLYGLIVIVPLWTAILLTIINFHRISKTAAFLLIPYSIWISYATVLNFAIYILNP